MKMKISVTGVKGKIGQRLVSLGAEPLFCDVTDADSVKTAIQITRPDVIIHCAAISSISLCEHDYENAIQVNVRGTNHVCEIAEDFIGTGKVVIISSEQVFDGEIGNYSEDDETNPINDYGRTKQAAEALAWIYDDKVIRLSRGVARSDVDIKTLINTLALGYDMDAPTFIKRSYCHLDFVAQAIWAYANRYEEMPRVLHYGGEQTMSAFEFESMLVKKVLGKTITPRDKEVKSFSPRPYSCGLNISLAKSLGLPTFSTEQTIERLANE